MNSLPPSLSLLFILMSSGAAALAAPEPTLLPDAVVDLDSAEGLRAVTGEWRFHEAAIVEVEHRSPGPDLKASGTPNRTHDIVPRAGARDFDDDSWEVLAPGTLQARRATGKLCFAWYRLRLTIPTRVGAFETAGSTAVLEVVLDDYAEVWVDGQLPLTLGQAGGHLVKGWNSPNRVVLGRDLQPGREVRIAIFGANGPLSDPPPNFIWIRSATIEFYRAGKLDPARKVEAEVARLDPALDAVLPEQVRLERIAEGFGFTEGPVWVPEGYLLFSDPNLNRIHRWTPDGEVSVYRTRSGYAGMDIGEYGQPGSNGLALDADGRLTICEHGNRRVTRLEKNGVLTVLADRYQGKRLNSPNDLVYRSDGALYFTDPPFGLPRFFDDPRRELAWCGVYCLRKGELRLVSKELQGPNGLALSPDESHLYVTNWDVKRKVVMRHRVEPGGGLSPGEVFFDMTSAPGEEALDGVKVDRAGDLFVSGPGGVWIISPTGKHLGTLRGPELPANFAWGDEDRRTLLLTARTGLYRLRTSIPGAGAWPAP